MSDTAESPSQQANVNKSALPDGFAQALDNVQVKPLTPLVVELDSGAAAVDVAQLTVDEDVVLRHSQDNTKAKFADGEVLPAMGKFLPDFEVMPGSSVDSANGRPEESRFSVPQSTELAQRISEILRTPEMSSPLSTDAMGVVGPAQGQMATQTQESATVLRTGESAMLKTALPAGMFKSVDAGLSPAINNSINPSISLGDGSQAPVKTDDHLASLQPAMRNTMQHLDNTLRGTVVQPETGGMAGTSKGATPGTAPEIAITQPISADLDKMRGSGVVQETLKAAVASGNNALVSGEDTRSPAKPDVLSRPGLPAQPMQSSTPNALSTAAITSGATLYAGPLTNEYREVQLAMARAANATPDPLNMSKNKDLNVMARVLPNQSLQRAAQVSLAPSGVRAINRVADLASAPDSSLSLEAAERASPTAPRTEPSALAALKPTVVAAPTSGGDAQVRGMDAEVREQIMRVMSRQALANGKLTLQLNPHELGILDIEFSTDKGEMQVAIVAREVATRDLLEASVARLRQSLQDAGVNVGQLDIRQDQDSNSSQQFRQSGGRSPQPGVVTTEQPADEVQSSSSRHDGDFDIYV